MKKIFRKTFVLVALAVTSIGVTSCDSETIAQLLPYILQMLMGGQAQTFTGSMQAQRLVREDVTNNNWLFANDKDQTYFYESTQTSELQVTGTEGNQTANLTIPTIQFEGITISGLSMEGIRYSTNNNVATLGEGAFYFSVTRTENGNTETITSDKTNEDYFYVYFEGGNISSSGVLTYSISLIMGTEAINIKYSGVSKTQQQ